MADLLERARKLGLLVKCSRQMFEVKFYSKSDQAHLNYFRSIEGLAGFVDGFSLAHMMGEKKLDKLKKQHEKEKEESDAGPEQAASSA
jgi:hypothetical protein